LDGERALELGRGSDPQVSGWVISSHAGLLLALGGAQEAARLAGEALEVPGVFYASFDLAVLLHDLGRGGEVVEWSADLSEAWREPALKIASGDFASAAERYEAMGARGYSAYALLRSGSDANVRRALDFYRGVGATRYVQEGEGLLAATA
jgi:hypothetical protein